MKYLKMFFGGLIGTIGAFASGIIIHAYFSGYDNANLMYLILTLPLMWGLKPLFLAFSSGIEEGKANVKQLSELNKKAADDLEFFKSDREIYEAINKLRATNIGKKKVELYQEKVELLAETRGLGFSDEVILFLVKAKNSDIQELIQKAKEAIESMKEIEKPFWESMEIDFEFWDILALDGVIPKHKDDREPPVGHDIDNGDLINELDYEDDKYGYYSVINSYAYWPDFVLDFDYLDIEGYVKDFQHLFDAIEGTLSYHKDLFEKKAYYFGKYSEHMSEIKAKILADWGESIHDAYFNKKVIVGMPYELCTDILGSPYEEKTLETADSVSLDCKFGRSEGKRGGVTYSHHLWFKDELLTKFSSQ